LHELGLGYRNCFKISWWTIF